MEILLPVVIVVIIGLVAGLGLSVASVVMAVPTDERVEKIRDCLPGANCGGCGYSGCDGYAEAVAKGECEPGLCAPGGVEVAKKIGVIMGIDAGKTVIKTAKVSCNGACGNTGLKMEYGGVETCKAANMLYAGIHECAYGCLGYGDCVSACAFGALRIENGKVIVDGNLCTGCGQCAKVCPKSVITVIPRETKYWVRCINRDKGAVANKVCSVSCIACGKCVRVCENGAVELRNNAAEINPELCIGCGKCAEACPKKCISGE